jgi:hypothetical protein
MLQNNLNMSSDINITVKSIDVCFECSTLCHIHLHLVYGIGAHCRTEMTQYTRYSVIILYIKYLV